MNHLRDVLDSAAGYQMMCADTLDHAATVRMRKATTMVGEQAQCFWMGDMGGFLDLMPVPELSGLPFDVCWFEGDAQSLQVDLGDGVAATLFGTLVWKQESGLVCIGFVKKLNNWVLAWRATNVDLGTGLYGLDAAAEGTHLIARACLYSIGTYCSAMNCTNVQRQEHRIDVKLQLARQKRRKPPLFSYWTLQLDGRREPGQQQGGTHASPRVHLRRGHPRQFAPGRWTWVQPCAVGNREMGMVHKDYAAGPGLGATPCN